jgi:hypothetical protein
MVSEWKAIIAIFKPHPHNAHIDQSIASGGGIFMYLNL